MSAPEVILLGMTEEALVDNGFELESGVPAVADYRQLRTACGLSARSVDAAEVGLPNSWYGITVRHGGAPVGMGRIVGDGGCFFQVVDRCAPPSAYVSLIADGDAHHLYRKFGFIETAPGSIGMHRVRGG